MKIYTRSGDSGKTSIIGGERLSKSHFRIEAYGTVDELNAAIGVIMAALSADFSDIRAQLQKIQADLFQVGALLATQSPVENKVTFSDKSIHFLESAMDQMDQNLPTLTAFILPGGSPQAAWAHMARTICRRAERQAVRLCETLNDEDLKVTVGYLNRLSDYLFVLARFFNFRLKLKDIVWTPPAAP